MQHRSMRIAQGVIWRQLTLALVTNHIVPRSSLSTLGVASNDVAIGSKKSAPLKQALTQLMIVLICSPGRRSCTLPTKTQEPVRVYSQGNCVHRKCFRHDVLPVLLSRLRSQLR